MSDDQARATPHPARTTRRLGMRISQRVAVAAVMGAANVSFGQELLPPPEADAKLHAATPVFTADEGTTRAALLLLDDAVTVQIDGRHHALLRALRHLKDPALEPLFAGLSTADRHPSLRIHGLLGAAELSPSSTLSVNAIAQVRRRDLQAELIGAALDGDLLDAQAIDTLLGWPALDPAVKLLLATPRVAAGTFDHQSAGYPALLTALDSKVEGQRGLAGLLLHELDDARGTEALDSLTQQAGSTAEAVTAMLLETAWTHQLRRSGNWALGVAEHDGTAERVEMLALKVAIRFGQRGADQAWSDRAAQATQDADLSRQTRLALVGLEIAPWLDATRFEALTTDDDPLIARLGQAGQQVAAFRQDAAAADAVETAVAELLESGHPQVWRWAAAYAQETGSAALGRTLLKKYQPGESHGRSRRLEAVVNATQVVVAAPDDATLPFFTEALSNPEADNAWRRAVLLGLIRDGGDLSLQIAKELPEFIDRDTESLVLVLRTQSEEALSDADQQTLEQLIQGQERLDGSLRVQTAWAYLHRTGQNSAATAALLAPAPPLSTADDRREP